jgi:hypothetical protein
MNNTNTNTNTNNVLPEIKTPKVFYPFMGLIIFMIIILSMVLFKVKINPFKQPSKSEQETISDIFIVLFFTLIIVTICIALLPNLKNIKTLFEQISNVTYIIIYTIFLILFFTLMPNNIINNYAYIITPLTAALGTFMFYKGLSQNYVEKFNVNYERIKTMITFFCLITIFIIYYNTDPGGYIQKYFGYSLLLTIILAVFGFLYLMIVLTLPDKVKESSTNAKSSNFLENFSGLSAYGSIGFLLFIIFITIVISTYPGGFFNDKNMSAFGIIMILMICVLWSFLLGANLFPEVTNNFEINDKLNFFKRSLLVLFGIIISSLIIFWFVYNIQNLSGKSGTVSFILNLFLVVIVLGLIYKTINVQLPVGNSKKNAFFSLILNTIFYIPCLFSNIFDSLGAFVVGQYNASTMGSILMLVFAIILLVIYFSLPTLFNKFKLQGGKQLVNKPVYTDTQYSLGTYQELNGSDTFDYQYAISCWVFIDAAPPNTNSSYSKFTSLLNFGNKPNILYNGTTNTLMVTMQQKDLKKTTQNNLTDFDENNNRILYINKNVLLQKWNNIIINYNGGVLDIFLNGELVKSDIGVVPYYTIDKLTIGEDNGIKGGICNVIYFRNVLNSSNIYYLYNLVKDKSPPVLDESNVTIVKNNMNTLSSSTKTVI